MRIQLTVIAAVMVMAMIGCGKKKELVLRQPPGGTTSSDSGKAAPGLGRAGGPPPADNAENADAKSEAKSEGEADAGPPVPGTASQPIAGARALAPPKRRGAFSNRNRSRSKSSDNKKKSAGEGESATPTPPANSGDDTVAANNPRQPPQQQEDEKPSRSLYDRATMAFQNSHENEAFQFLYAHALTAEDGLKENPINWYPGVSEPRLALRWGVGVEYHKGRFDGDPPVIGDPVSDSGRGGGGDSGSDTGSGVPGARGLTGSRGRGAGFGNRNRQSQPTPDKEFEDPTEQLEYYTGDFGTRFINRFELRRTNPKAFYGLALKNIDLDKTFNDDSNNSSRSAGASPPGGGGDFALAGSGQRRRPPPRNNQSQDDELDYEAEPTSLAPGVMMLGKGNQKSLLEKAKANGLDLLVVFVVRIDHSQSRNTTKSKTQAKMFNVSTGDQLQMTKTLTNTVVAKAREEGASDDPVEMELDKLFTKTADEDFKASEMPEIEAKFIIQRVNDLVEASPDNPLPALVEMKYYFENGILPKSEFVSAVEGLIGAEQAKDLIDGNTKQKESAIAAWLPGQFNADSVNNFR